MNETDMSNETVSNILRLAELWAVGEVIYRDDDDTEEQ